MSAEVFERFTASLALLAGGVGVLLVAARLLPSAPGRQLLAAVAPYRLWMAFLVALGATLGSLVFSEHYGFEPCRYCWFQRIAMFSSVIVLMVGALRRDPQVAWYAGPLAMLGGITSTWHYLVEWNPRWESGVCQVGPPCTAPYFRAFEFVSLALMALCAFVAILALLLCPTDVPAATDAEAAATDAEAGS